MLPKGWAGMDTIGSFRKEPIDVLRDEIAALRAKVEALTRRAAEEDRAQDDALHDIVEHAVAERLRAAR